MQPQSLQINSLLTAGTSLSETVTHWGAEGVDFEGTIRITNGQTIAINGKFIGGIESNGCVIVCKNGSIFGTIQAAAMQIDGKISKQKEDDSVIVSGPVVIGAEAEIDSNIRSKGISISYGAIIKGSITTA